MKQITAKQAFAAGTKAAHHDTTKVKHSCGCWKTYRRYITLNEVAEMENHACAACEKTAKVETVEVIEEIVTPAQEAEKMFLDLATQAAKPMMTSEEAAAWFLQIAQGK